MVKKLKLTSNYYRKSNKIFDFCVVGCIPNTRTQKSVTIRSDTAVNAMNIYDRKHSPYVAIYCNKKF